MKIGYSHHWLSQWLRPLSWVYRAVIFFRRFFYRISLFKSKKFPVPVIVVGNLTVGGVGKTPLVAWLVENYRKQGYQPGIVSRGYGGHAKQWPQYVTVDSDPYLVGDEPVMLAMQTNAPIVCDPNRVRAVEVLLEKYHCDIVISDDGLQHYRLQRDVEIIVVDGARRFGNAYCLPAGPLREPLSRLKQVDWVICNGEPEEGEIKMSLIPGEIYSINNPENIVKIDVLNKTVHAVAGIGNPQRFFDQLTSMGFSIIPHAFPDHHNYQPSNLVFNDDLPILMTEKDAVKCRAFAQEHWYCLPVRAMVNDLNSYSSKLPKSIISAK